MLQRESAIGINTNYETILFIYYFTNLSPGCHQDFVYYRLSPAGEHVCKTIYMGSKIGLATSMKNKKLRYSEEHSASVVLSWCTL